MKTNIAHKKIGLFILAAFFCLVFTGFSPGLIDPVYADGNYACPYTHRHLLLLYPSTNVTYVKNGATLRFKGTMNYKLRDTLVRSFKNLPVLIQDGSAGMARATAEVRIMSRAITKISKIGTTNYWVNSSDIQSDLTRYAPPGKYDAVHVVWYSGPIPAYWGLGGVFINNYTTTFSSLIAGQSFWWTSGEAPGEPFLHEWLHAMCRFFSWNGYTMPFYDADGASSHGYIHSNIDGWMDYYRDLMQGMVWEPSFDSYTGVTAEAWCEGPPR